MVPREIPPSSEKIALRGGYDSRIFKDWHKSKKKAEDELRLRLICNNIVMGSLASWWHDFRDIRLSRFDGIKVRFGSSDDIGLLRCIWIYTFL